MSTNFSLLDVMLKLEVDLSEGLGHELNHSAQFD